MKVETVIVRDPDGGTEVSVYVDGEPVDASEYVIDAGAGWEWEDWCERRDSMLAEASPAARAELESALDDPPGGQYVDGREDAPWLP